MELCFSGLPNIWTIIYLGSNKHRLESVAWLNPTAAEKSLWRNRPQDIKAFEFSVCLCSHSPPAGPHMIGLALSCFKKEIWENRCSCSMRAQRRKAKRESFTIVINVLCKSSSHQTYVLLLEKLRKASRKLLILRPNIIFFKREPWIRNTVFARVHAWILFSRCRPKQAVGVRTLRTEWFLLMMR